MSCEDLSGHGIAKKLERPSGGAIGRDRERESSVDKPPIGVKWRLLPRLTSREVLAIPQLAGIHNSLSGFGAR